VDLSVESLSRFRAVCEDTGETPLANVVERVAERLGPGPHLDYNAVFGAIEADADDHEVKLTAKRIKLLQAELTSRDETARPVVRKRSRLKAETVSEREALYGRYSVETAGRSWLVEYEPDTELRDTEQVPLLEEGGIGAFLRREVLPHAPDAWIDEDKTVIGYEISFTRHFYKPRKQRGTDEIRAEIFALEEEAEGLLARIMKAG